MGSTYHISYVRERGQPDAARMKAAVEGILAEVDRAVSTYRDDSDVARFNAAAAGTCMPMPAIVLDLTRHAQKLHAQSSGAFDITLLPVLNAWGFGPKSVSANAGDDASVSAIVREAMDAGGQQAPAPTPAADAASPATEAALQSLAGEIGMQHLRIEGQTLCKDAPVSIEFNSIAAGYAIDRIAQHMHAHGVQRYLIEVTGELRAAGRKADGTPWRVAIEAPLEEGRQAQKILALDAHALSTSGDYRQYREHQGQRLSHTIDPRTLRPVTHPLAAVTVAASTALEADGLSTLLMVLGPEQGMHYAERHGIAALFVIRQAAGFESRQTTSFTRYFPSSGE